MVHSTHLAIPVFADSIETLRALIHDAADAGATIVEIRLDLCEDLSDDDVRAAAVRPPEGVLLLLTHRSATQGGECRDDDDARLARIDRLAPAFDLLDVELDTWRSSETRRDVVRQALAQPFDDDGTGRRGPRRLILSAHDFRGRPTSLQNDLLACIEAAECDIVKVAWHARSVRDCFEAFEIAATCPKPVIPLCMGEFGVISRLLAPKFGAFATFASLDDRSSTAPGQPTVHDLKSVFRWDALTTTAAVYGVIGHPVGHSLSPALHNAVFAVRGTEAVYVPIDIAPSYEALKAFLLEVEGQPRLGFRGFSVTLPHKENALRFLQERRATVDDAAARIGAVNTLAFTPEFGWRGTNTDYMGSIELVAAGLDKSPDRWKGIRATILGAGGVARAVLAALTDYGVDVTVTNRTEDRATTLSAEFGAKVVSWSERASQDADLLVNCTSVGMAPGIDASPWPGATFPGLPTVADTIYAPAETQLLRDARGAGCRVVGGRLMFTSQAAAQAGFWLESEVDRAAYERALNRVVATTSGK